MSLRVSIVGVIWFFVLLMIVFSPIQQDQLLMFGLIPTRSFVHIFLYWGFVHVWICALKKQLKFSKLKKNAFAIVAVIAISLATFSEVISYAIHLDLTIGYWNFLFDILGVLLGMISFRLLYSTCY